MRYLFLIAAGFMTSYCSKMQDCKCKPLSAPEVDFVYRKTNELRIATTYETYYVTLKEGVSHYDSAQRLGDRGKTYMPLDFVRDSSMMGCDESIIYYGKIYDLK
jgi:hypothetical protein